LSPVLIIFPNRYSLVAEAHANGEQCCIFCTMPLPRLRVRGVPRGLARCARTLYGLAFRALARFAALHTAQPKYAPAVLVKRAARAACSAAALAYCWYGVRRGAR
jgi:hypothetical protein